MKRGPVPYYHQIGTLLRDRIANGEFAVGDRIPSEEELCQLFSVSRATVRQALQSLEADGLISRKAGRGSFVQATNSSIAELKMTCLLEDLIALGIPATNKVSDVGFVGSSRSVANALGVSLGQSVFTFLRIVAVEDQPFAANRVFLPDWMGRRLRRGDLEDAHLLRTLEKKSGIKVVRAEQVIEAILADTNQASLLTIDVGSALLSVTRNAFDQDNSCIEHSVTLYRSDRTRFSISQRHRSSAANGWILEQRGPRAGRDARASLSRRSAKQRAS